MDTTEFERLLQAYLRNVNDPNVSADTAELNAYDALTEAAGLLGVSMLMEKTS